MSLRHRLLALVLAAVSAAAPTLALAEQQRELAPRAPAPAGERRVALVIGNSAYKSSPLRNPVNDARAIADTLAATGFSVTFIEDATQTTMWRAIRVFGDRLRGAGSVGLFYYAGHGVQVNGRNFLVPVNADLQREDEVEFQAVDANAVLAKMDSAKNGLNLMILDACRNNPFARGFRSSAQGLAQMDAPSGTLVAFATSPGAIASDGADGKNSVYTKHLLANLPKPGIPVELMFKQVRIGVSRETRERQIPWESSSLRGNFAFVPADARLASEERRVEIENALAAERAEQQRRMEAVMQEMLARQRAEFEAEARKQGIALPPLKPVAPVSLAAEPLKEVAPASPPARQPARVASLAPTEIAAQSEASRLPKVGDYWVYRYMDTIAKRRRTVRFEITGASREGLLESGGFVDMPPEIRAAAPGVRLVYRGFWELSPYALAFGGFRANERWRVLTPEKSPSGCLALGIRCDYSGKVLGTERISTPAGTFDTVKVMVDSNGTGGVGNINSNWRQLTFWYSETTKRMVKAQVRTRAGYTIQDDYDLELTAFKLN